MSEEMKACPLCGESVLAVAKKCKHCGSMIDETAIEKPVEIIVADGLYVEGVNPQGNAYSAGVRNADLLVSYNDTPLDSQAKLNDLASQATLDLNTVKLVRDNQFISVDVPKGQLGIPFVRFITGYKALQESVAQVDIAKPSVDYEIALLAIPVLATFLILFWVSGMNLLQSPGDTLNLIVIATVLGTAIIAAMEGSNVGMKGDSDKGTYSPIAWFFMFVLLWIVAYPAYLFKRRHSGLTDRLGLGLLVMTMFFASSTWMYRAIESQKAEILHNLEKLQKDLSSLANPFADALKENQLKAANDLAEKTTLQENNGDAADSAIKAELVSEFNSLKENWTRWGAVQDGEIFFAVPPKRAGLNSSVFEIKRYSEPKFNSKGEQYNVTAVRKEVDCLGQRIRVLAILDFSEEDRNKYDVDYYYGEWKSIDRSQENTWTAAYNLVC